MYIKIKCDKYSGNAESYSLGLTRLVSLRFPEWNGVGQERSRWSWGGLEGRE